MNWPVELISRGNKILDKIHTNNVLPAKENVLRFFNLDPSSIKVIILGQDPYPTPGVANGFAFAVNKGSRIPQSLKNVFNEIKKTKGFVSADETLEHWTKQGVLLLNVSLTVEKFKPNSHKRIWSEFTFDLINWLSNHVDATWVLWGNEAKKYKEMIGSSNIIEDAHPSPLAVRYRKGNTFKELKDIDW